MCHTAVCRIVSAGGRWVGLATSRRPNFRASVAAKMDVVIDLTAEEEHKAKQAIMAHAGAVLAAQHASRKELKAGQLRAELIDLAEDSEEQEVHLYQDEIAAAAGCMETGAKRQKHASPSRTSNVTAQPGQQWGAAACNPMNDMLKALHQERMRRLQEQAQHAQHTNSTVGPEAAEPNTGTQAAEPAKSSPRAPRVSSKRKAPTSESAGSQPQTAQAVHQAKAKEQMSSSNKDARSCEPAQITILSYNLWFEEGVALQERMAGLADIILTHQPDVLLFQEVTVNMLKLWAQQHSWLTEHYTWTQPPPHQYFTLIGFKRDRMQPLLNAQRSPFDNSQMGRDVLSLGIAINNRPDVPALLVATSHLESPIRGQQFLPVRKAQVLTGQQLLQDRARQLESALAERYRNQEGHDNSVDVIWGGDTNWINAHSEAPPLQAGWQDVWSTLHPGLPGYTWDSTTNAMLQGTKLSACRMDRFFVKLRRWEVASVELVGNQVLPGVKAKHYGKTVDVHVSDHYGLLLKLVCPPRAAQ